MKFWVLALFAAVLLLATHALERNDDVILEDLAAQEPRLRDVLSDLKTGRVFAESGAVKRLLWDLIAKLNKETTDDKASVDTAVSKEKDALKAYEVAKGVRVGEEADYTKLKKEATQEIALLNQILGKIEELDSVRKDEKPVSVSETWSSGNTAGQIMAQAACVTMMKGSGWAFAVSRQCGSQYPTCAQVCANLKESQAGKLSCFNSMHLYGNQPAKFTSMVGLKTYRYNGCGGGCGPNTCCCTQNGNKETLLEEEPEDSDDDLPDNDSDGDSDSDNLLTEDLDGGKILGSFSAGGLQGQILAQATCTAMRKGAGWSFAVQRVCSSAGATCSQVCAALTESQAGQLKCFNSLNVYGNREHSNAMNVGLKTYKYNGCGGGCGPNYCCCGSGNPTADLQKDSDEEEESGDDNDDDDSTADVAEGATFSAQDTEGQVLAEATCTALNTRGGWSFAIRRHCSKEEETCAQICEKMAEGQARRMKCFNSLHIYGNAEASGTNKLGLKTYRYDGCGGGCGPNYCCCHNA